MFTFQQPVKIRFQTDFIGTLEGKLFALKPALGSRVLLR